MRSRTAAILVLVLVIVMVGPAAGGDDGRAPGSTPGVPDAADAIATTSDVGTDIDRTGVGDQVILDDLIVDGSLCVGWDCVNGEAFGFDTIRLKENNLRIRFEDTSNSASFPTNDWQLTANGSANGGGSYFAIDDIDGGTTPFLVEAGAPNRGIYLDYQGNVGFGRDPVTEIHSVDGDTPTLRLEQDGSSGWSPQTWDLAANETNFFIRDVTNGSRLPFRIRPGADTSAIDIGSDSQVGIGTAAADVRLHVYGNDESNAATNTTALKIENYSSTKKPRHMVFIVNNGASTISFDDTSQDHDWYFGTSIQNHFRIGYHGTGTLFEVEDSGDASVVGDMNAVAFNTTSDRNLKTAVHSVDAAVVLARVVGLDIATWSFIDDGSGSTHIGPMAQDFAATFGFGEGDTTINLGDAVGVSLASIQALAAENDALEIRIAELEAQLAELLAAGQ